MPKFCSHYENRKKVCAPCGKKIKCRGKPISTFLINDKQVKLIQKYLCYDFNLNKNIYPLSVCGSCRLTLQEHEKGQIRRRLLPMRNYKDLILLKETRNQSKSCNCYICLTARETKHQKIEKGRGHKRKFDDKILVGINASSDVTSFSKTKKEKYQDKSNIYKICSDCYQVVGKGIQRKCGSSTKTMDNILSTILEKLPERQHEQLTAKLIHLKLQNVNSDPQNSKTSSMKLQTLGRSMTIDVNPKHKQVFFSKEKLDNYQVNTFSSLNQMKKLTNFLRCSAGKKSVPVNYYSHASQKGKTLKDLYKTGYFEFDLSKKINKEESSTEKDGKQQKLVKTDLKEKRPVVWADAEELLDAVICHRQFVGDLDIKITADDGGGFFKISMSVSSRKDTQEEFGDDNDYIPEKRRKTYQEGGSTSHQAKFTSVKKLILLAIVPQIKESYDNLKVLFELTQLNNIPFKFAADLKLLLIINGQQTASATCPCPYCFVKLYDLKNCQDETDDNGLESTVTNNLKNYGDLKKDFEKYSSFGNLKKKRKIL